MTQSDSGEGIPEVADVPNDSVADPLPEFDEAVRQFEDFLGSQGKPTEIAWVARGEFYCTIPPKWYVLWPPRSRNINESRDLYDRARARGLVELDAVAQVGDKVAARVFAPAKDEIQGWPQGLKLSIRDPLAKATPVPRLLWVLHRFRPAYLRFQSWA